jgi:peptide deformylase
MLHTMYTAGGVGLTAQVDVRGRLIIMDTSPTRDRQQVLADPELVEGSGACVVGAEAGLSVPQIIERVTPLRA